MASCSALVAVEYFESLRKSALSPALHDLTSSEASARAVSLRSVLASVGTSFWRSAPESSMAQVGTNSYLPTLTFVLSRFLAMHLLLLVSG